MQGDPVCLVGHSHVTEPVAVAIHIAQREVEGIGSNIRVQTIAVEIAQRKPRIVDPRVSRFNTQPEGSLLGGRQR